MVRRPRERDKHTDNSLDEVLKEHLPPKVIEAIGALEVTVSPRDLMRPPSQFPPVRVEWKENALIYQIHWKGRISRKALAGILSAGSFGGGSLWAILRQLGLV